MTQLITQLTHKNSQICPQKGRIVQMTPPTAPDYSFDVRDRFPRSKLTLQSIQLDLCAVLLQHTTLNTQTYSKKGLQKRSVWAK